MGEGMSESNTPPPDPRHGWWSQRVDAMGERVDREGQQVTDWMSGWGLIVLAVALVALLALFVVNAITGA